LRQFKAILGNCGQQSHFFLKIYLLSHPEIEGKCSKNGGIKYLTTENAEIFNANAARFLGIDIQSESIHF
jgi:glutamate racemase